MKDSILESIEKQVAKLSLREHIELIDKLMHQLKEKTINSNQQLDWKDLYGLGKGLWGDEDVQDHVHRLREDRI
jgi:hypothetical protein